MPDLDHDACELLDLLGEQHGALTPAELHESRTGSLPPELAGTPEDLAVRADVVLPLPEAPIRARLYSDRRTDPKPLVLWLHGGGFCTGSLDDLDTTCSAIARAAGVTVVSLEYRLAPEHPFPAALTDVVDALAWLREHGRALGGDGRVAVGGQSAGANLAVAAGLAARERGGPALDAQVLCYPALDFRLDSGSHRRFAGVLLQPSRMRWYHEQYLGGRAPTPLSAPLLAESFAGLAPALVITAGHDPYRDDGRRLAERLAADGVAVEHREYPGTIHAFLNFPGALAAARIAAADVAAHLRAAFKTHVTPRLQHATTLYAPAAAAELRHFYRDVLGLAEKPVPAAFSGMGLLWFDAGDGERELHFVPDGPPHVCLEVTDLDDAAGCLAAAERRSSTTAASTTARACLRRTRPATWSRWSRCAGRMASVRRRPGGEASS